MPVAGSMNAVGVIAAGASSRPSIVVTLPCFVRMTMKPPPPTPDENGSVTPSTAAAATAASTALPLRLSTSSAASVATLSTVAAAPPAPSATAFGTCWYGCWCLACAPTGAASTSVVTSRASCERLDMWSTPSRTSRRMSPAPTP